MDKNSYETEKPGSDQSKNQALSTAITIVFLILFFPVGLILVWTVTDWKNVTKGIVTAVVILVYGFSFYIFDFSTRELKPIKLASNETKKNQGPIDISELLRMRNADSEELVEALSSENDQKVMTAFGILEDRRDPAGVQKAKELLEIDNKYIWFNATLYLGSLERKEAVPYLIKGLKHPASKAHKDASIYLQKITGKSFGTNYEKWLDWWEKTHPDKAQKAKAKPRATGPGNFPETHRFLIHEVLGPTTIGQTDGAIKLAGVKLKDGVKKKERKNCFVN